MPDQHVETFHSDGQWFNAVVGSDQVSEPFATQEEAASDGREMAQELAVEHVVKGLDGGVEERVEAPEQLEEPLPPL